MLKLGILFIKLVYLCSTWAKEMQFDITTAPAPSSTLQRSTLPESTAVTQGITKRDLKGNGFTAPAHAVGLAAQSDDPAPEFYR